MFWRKMSRLLLSLCGNALATECYFDGEQRSNSRWRTEKSARTRFVFCLFHDFLGKKKLLTPQLAMRPAFAHSVTTCQKSEPKILQNSFQGKIYFLSKKRIKCGTFEDLKP